MQHWQVVRASAKCQSWDVLFNWDALQEFPPIVEESMEKLSPGEHVFCGLLSLFHGTSGNTEL